MKKHAILLLAVLLGLGILAGCKSDDSDDAVLIPAAYSGVIVDPYIVGAVLCEDKNNDGSCGADEQVSSTSDANGNFTFSEAVTAGSTIIVKTHGTHNGVTYTLDISRKIDSADDVSNQVISPMTTLGTKGLTATQIATMLQTAGLTDITAADVTADPMDGISAMTGSITAAQVVKIRSSIAVYAMLKIMNGSTTMSSLTGTQLYYSATTAGQPVYEILNVMVDMVTAGLDPALITSIQSQINNAPISLPSVTAEDVVNTAVAITDYIAAVGYETCNATSGDAAAKVTAALNEVNSKTNTGASISTWANELGPRFYGARNKATLSSFRSYMGSFTDVVAGLDCSSGTFIIDSSGSTQCYSQ